MRDGCPDCPPDWKNGRCWWHLCDLTSTEQILTDGLTYKGAHVSTGDVLLCHGHFTRWQRLGRLDIDRTVIDAAILHHETVA